MARITPIRPEDQAEQPTMAEIAESFAEQLAERADVYRYAKHLVKVDEEDGEISPLNKDALTVAVENLKPPPPHKLVAQIARNIVHSDLCQRHFRVLKAVTRFPVFHGDFRLSPKGYDTETGFLYIPRPELEHHSFRLDATQADAIEAYQKLSYVFSDFPFEAEGDRSNVIGALLTIVVGRQAIRGAVPMMAVNANQQSNGKSLLCDTVCRIATGTGGASMSKPPTQWQWMARLDAAVQMGAKVCYIDNVTGRITSHQLASVVTSEQRSVWKFSDSTLKSVRNSLVVLVNGNNLQFDADNARRVVWITMWHPDPQSRQDSEFRINKDHGVSLSQYIERKWPLYLDAAMTIILAWRNAGMPKVTSRVFGTFANWESVIGGMLNFVEAPDFLRDQSARSDKANYELQEMIEFCERVSQRFGPRVHTGIMISEIARLLAPGGEWAGTLQAVTGKSAEGIAISLGKFLKLHEGTLYGQYRVRTRRDGPGSYLHITMVE